MTRVLLLLACLSFALGGERAAFAQTSDAGLAQGSIVKGVLTLDGKQIALPKGDWIVAHDGPNGWNNPTIGAFGYIRTVVLLHLQCWKSTPTPCRPPMAGVWRAIAAGPIW